VDLRPCQLQTWHAQTAPGGAGTPGRHRVPCPTTVSAAHAPRGRNPLLNASQQVGRALGLALFSGIATSRTTDLLATGAPVSEALTSGFHQALLAGSIFELATAIIALRTSNTGGDVQPPVAGAAPEPAGGSPLRTPQPVLEKAA
jgi:hypothetical protein